MSGKKKTVKLTEEQKAQILEEFENTPDLILITRNVFNNEELDGRTLEGKAVKDFLIENDLAYNVRKPPEAKKAPELTVAQKEFLMSDQINAQMNALEVARLCFSDASIKSLSVEHRLVSEFIKTYRSDIEEDEAAFEKWFAPKSMSRIIKKVNDWAGQSFDEATIPNKHKRNCEKLMIYLKSVRFCSIINQYSTESDRELFESEFVRAAWDKPDLTVDEQNSYINVCTNYVRLKHIQKRMDKLNTLLDDADNERELTMRLTDIIKTTSEELNQCEKRLESLIKDLNGSRQKRLQEKGDQAGSVSALVEAFQDKEERDRMIMMAEHQNKLVSDETDRLESMDEWKARVLGIQKRELT
ncbi:hypothetical protein N9955_00750 [bacterium]|nr:hypothetical protein [bacterium]